MSSALALLTGLVLAQQYRFPTSSDDQEHFYPTAYYDHSGVDWNCGGIRYSGHHGNDFGFGSFDGMYAGRDIVAAAAGTVVYTNDGEYDECTTGDCEGGGGFGNYVKIQHADGKYTYYAHMRQWSVAVEVGDEVACGQKIGEGGSSGYSTGPHLHFEVRDAAGNRIDSFSGPCSDSPGYWVSQGAYDDLPALTCEEIEPCEPEGALRCGESASTTNSGGASTHAYYGCSEFTYSGPERAWSFSTELDEPVTLRLTDLSDDLDLYVLTSDACDGTGCLTASTNGESSAGSASADESITFDAEAGRTYTVVVDGWGGAISDFTLSAECEGASAAGADDTGTQGADPGAGDDPGPSPGGGVEPPGARWEQVPRYGGGCGGLGGCAAADLGAGLWIWALSAALLRRRRSPPTPDGRG